VDLRPLLACLGLLLAGCGAEVPQEESNAKAETAIRACFAAYKAAILEGDGEAAAVEVDAATIAYYEKMLELSLDASAEETKRLPLMDRMTVLIVRARVEPELLRTVDGRELFVHAVKSGMVGKSSVIHNELGEVKVSGAHATGEHVSAGQKTRIRWRFHREEGAWRMDILSIFPAATLAFQKTIADSGMTENEFIFRVIAMTGGTEPTDDIWQPVSR
jgi:hypothetical protein